MLVFLVLASTLILSFSGSKSDSLHTADSDGPISIMSDHMHKKGEIMFSYRFNHMFMNKTMNGTKSLGIDEVMSAPNSSSNDISAVLHDFLEVIDNKINKICFPINHRLFPSHLPQIPIRKISQVRLKSV